MRHIFGDLGKAFVALWLFFCVCPCVGTMSLAPTDRWDEVWPLGVLLCSLFLSSITVFPPFCSPHCLPALISLQWRILTEKGTWLLAWGRGGGGSRSLLELVFTLHFSQKGLQLVGQSARFLTCWQGLWLPIYLYRISRKKSLSPHGGGHQKWHCPHCNTTTADNKELRTRRIERVTEELITSQQHAGCLNKYGGRKKGRRRRRRCKGRESKPQLMGE